MMAAFLPAAIMGFIFEKPIKHYLFGMWPVTLAWFIGGIAILLIARKRNHTEDATLGQQLDKLTIPQALLIGRCNVLRCGQASVAA